MYNSPLSSDCVFSSLTCASSVLFHSPFYVFVVLDYPFPCCVFISKLQMLQSSLTLHLCLIPSSEKRVAVSCFCLSVCHLNGFVSSCLFSSGRTAPFSISCHAGLVLVNYLSSSLSRRIFISPFLLLFFISSKG